MKREACSLGTMISISTQSPSWRAFRHQQTARPPRHLLSVASPAWQINLGHFDTRDEAVSMQRELAALGYTADIATADDAGVTLLLGGFGERKLAELAAKDIMQRTRLNGLWVSGGK